MPANPVVPKANADLYASYRFRIKLDGRYVAGVSKVSALTRTTQVVTHRAEGDPSTPRRMPGQSEYQAITLERGVTYDVEFEQWANKVWDYHNSTRDDQEGRAGNQDVSLKDFRKDIILEIYNETGQKVDAYTVYRCWPSEFSAMPEMDATGNAVAIQRLKLENEGWKRDSSLAPPNAPDSSFPGS